MVAVSDSSAVLAGESTESDLDEAWQGNTRATRARAWDLLAGVLPFSELGDGSEEGCLSRSAWKLTAPQAQCPAEHGQAFGDRKGPALPTCQRTGKSAPDTQSAVKKGERASSWAEPGVGARRGYSLRPQILKPLPLPSECTWPLTRPQGEHCRGVLCCGHDLEQSPYFSA